MTAITFGTFDNFHLGHLSYLTQAAKYCNHLIVVVARDQNVLVTKGKLPQQNEEERLIAVEEKILKIAERILSEAKAEPKDSEVIFNIKAVLGDVHNKFKIFQKYKIDLVCLGYDQEVDEARLKEVFSGDIIRMKAFCPEKYKSSKIRD